MRLIAILGALLALPLGCTHVDVKARENLRLGPLRELRMVPLEVDQTITVNAGTDAFTDAELADVEAALGPALEASFAAVSDQRLDGETHLPLLRMGMARVGACKLRAGPNERFVVYLAKCHVSIIIDGVTVAEATGEGLRRTESIMRRGRPAPSQVARDPLVELSESRAALMGALEAAASVLVHGARAPDGRDDRELPILPRAQRAVLARARVASATNANATSDEKIAALFDLRSAGAPSDASLAAPLLEALVPAGAAKDGRTPMSPRAGDGAFESALPEDPVRERAVIGAVPEGASEPAAREGPAAPEVPDATQAPTPDVAVIAAAIDAIGELCDPALRERIEAVTGATDDLVERAKARALPRLRACGSIAAPQSAGRDSRVSPGAQGPGVHGLSLARARLYKGTWRAAPIER